MALNVKTPDTTVDWQALEFKVKDMYRLVAEQPDGKYHFEMGRALAERLGYPPSELNRIPAPAVDSFAGVGNPLALAGIEPGNHVLDLGSGSGMDSMLAALQTGPEGRVYGLDMTEAQREKARRLAQEAGLNQVSFHEGYIEKPPFDAGSVDVVISNGVINLSPDKYQVFAEAARVLRPGGRLAIADIVTEKPLPDNVTCDATLWAACIGGAMQQEDYQDAITAAGLQINTIHPHHEYQFLTESARGAGRKYGVKSISLLAIKT